MWTAEARGGEQEVLRVVLYPGDQGHPSVGDVASCSPQCLEKEPEQLHAGWIDVLHVGSGSEPMYRGVGGRGGIQRPDGERLAGTSECEEERNRSFPSLMCVPGCSGATG